MDFIGGFVFSDFGVRHVASQRFVFHENQHVCVFVGPDCHVSSFFRIKKDAQRDLATNGPYESP